MAQKRSDTALLIIDVINDLDFPGGENVLPWALRMVERLAPFAARLRKAGIPVIHCTRSGVRGRKVARALKPQPDDYFILQPQPILWDEQERRRPVRRLFPPGAMDGPETLEHFGRRHHP